MNDNWYYVKDGRPTGPVSELQLKSLVANQMLGATDLVWQDGSPDWVPANSVPGLLIGSSAVKPRAALPWCADSAEQHADTASNGAAMRFHVSNSHRAAPSRRPAVAPMRIPFMWTVTGVVVLSVFGGVFIAALSSTGRSDSAGQSSPGSSSNTNEYVVDLVGDPNRVRHDGFHTKGIFLKAGETITIDVLSERSSDVDLFLRDPQNDFVASDISYSKNCHVQTTVVSSGFYTIVVDNLGPGSNRCHVSYTIE